MWPLDVHNVSFEVHGIKVGTVVPTKNDSDVMSCLHLLSINITLYTPLELTRINRSLVY